MLLSGQRFSLNYSDVMKIVALYGPHQHISRELLTKGNCCMSLGWRRRALDALMCVRKIAPFWTEYLPEQAHQLLLLDTAEAKIKQGKSCLIELEEDCDTISYQIDKTVLGAVIVYQAEMAYCTTQNALYLVMRDINAEFDPALSYAEDWPTDFGDVPTAIEAARVFDFADVGGTAHHEIEARTQAREFWLWWLDEVVPICGVFE